MASEPARGDGYRRLAKRSHIERSTILVLLGLQSQSYSKKKTTKAVRVSAWWELLRNRSGAFQWIRVCFASRWHTLCC
jgi:hypothetical protein